MKFFVLMIILQLCTSKIFKESRKERKLFIDDSDDVRERYSYA